MSKIIRILSALAKALNIRIILDISLNHVSEYHPWFQKSLAQDPIYDDYFVWSKELPAGYGRAWGEKEDPTAVWHKKEERDAWYYGVFGWTQPAVSSQIHHNTKHLVLLFYAIPR